MIFWNLLLCMINFVIFIMQREFQTLPSSKADRVGQQSKLYNKLEDKVKVSVG